MKNLSLKFLTADMGEQVLSQLGHEHRYASVFSADHAAIINNFKDPEQKRQMLAAADFQTRYAQPVVTKLLGHLCPEHILKKQGMTRWVCQQYLDHRHNNRPLLSEDFKRVKSDIGYFDGLCRSGTLPADARDLMQYTLKEMQDMISPYQLSKMRKDAARAMRRLTGTAKDAIMSESTIVYDGKEGQVVVPHTLRASQYWGNQTKWCISGAGGQENFSDYNYVAPVLMLLPKEGNKVAIAEGEFYDVLDNVIDNLPTTCQTLFDACLDHYQETPAIREKIAQLMDAPLPLKPPEKPEVPEGHPYATELLNVRQGRLYKVNEALWYDRDFALLAVAQNDGALRYIDEKFQDDRGVIDAAVQSGSGYCLGLLPEKYRIDPQFIEEQLVRSHELPFMIEEQACTWASEGIEIALPSASIIGNTQARALARMIASGGEDCAQRKIHLCRSVWGDPQKIWGDPSVVVPALISDEPLKVRSHQGQQVRRS